MSDLEPIPDDFWRKAFDDAEEAPPPRVWAAIERQLDDDRAAAVVPLLPPATTAGYRLGTWGLGVAASVLLLLAGWWLTTRPTASTPQPAIARIEKKQPTVQPEAATPDPATRPDSHAPVANQPVAPVVSIDQVPTVAQVDPIANTPQPDVSLSITGADKLARLDPPSTSAPALPAGQRITTFSAMQLVAASTPAVKAEIAATDQAAPVDALVSSSAPTQPTATLATIGRLSARQASLRGARPIQRIVWISPEAPYDVAAVAKPRAATRKNDRWASVSLMPGSFDPALALQSSSVPGVAQVRAFNSLSSGGSSLIGSRPDLSMAYQVSGGMALSEHWTVETGVGYLACQSTVTSPALFSAQNSVSSSLVNTAPNASGNLYLDVLQSQKQTGQAVYSAAADKQVTYAYQQRQYNVQEQQTLTNQYQFVQVPVQVGYQLRPKKRFGLSLLGGMLANVFVKNSVGSQLTVTSDDGVYKPVSVAALVGARFRYRPTVHWSASLAGVYQPSLSTITQPGSAIDSRPTTSGMSFGLDYHF
ncbi:hypothetical protein GCM10027578_33050 [Spirosoma luteolum]